MNSPSARENRRNPHSSRGISAYVVPFALFMGGLVLVDLVKQPNGGTIWLQHPEYWIYPLQTLVCAGALVFYWSQYDFGRRAGWMFGISAGLVVLGLWIAPQVVFGANQRLQGFDPSRLGEDALIYYTTVLARFTRLVVIVPLVEEIFWRGFLMRFLIREDFSTLPIGTFQLRSFAIVSVAFMLVHGMSDWPAAFLCGLIYNFVAVRTGSLGACILAHAVTNLGLGIYIMTTRQWGFW